MCSGGTLSACVFHGIIDTKCMQVSSRKLVTSVFPKILAINGRCLSGNCRHSFQASPGKM